MAMQRQVDCGRGLEVTRKFAILRRAAQLPERLCTAVSAFGAVTYRACPCRLRACQLRAWRLRASEWASATLRVSEEPWDWCLSFVGK